MLIGREKEFSKLKENIEKSWKNHTPLSIYISGAPGTGKTATTKAVIQSFNKDKKVQCIHINCVSVNRKADVEKSILTELGIPLTKGSTPSDILRRVFKETKKKIIIVLDEIDHLNSRRHVLLYSAFGWPNESEGRVIVIGIANSLDLTERLLPKLKVDGLQPEVFSFQPYEREQIANILTKHLSTQTVGNEAAIDLCARKVAAQTGDIRLALSTIDKAFLENEDEEDNENQSFVAPPAGVSTPKKNNLRAVLQVFKGVQESPLQRSTLPEHSRIFLATLVKLVGNTKTKSTTRIKLISSYEKVCRNLKITAVNGDERIQAIENLETMSLISCNGTNQKSKITFIDDVGVARGKIADANLVANVDGMDL